MWDPTSHILIISRDVKFDESPFLKSNMQIDETSEQKPLDKNQQSTSEVEVEIEDVNHDMQQEQQVVDMPQATLRRSTRT